MLESQKRAIFIVSMVVCIPLIITGLVFWYIINQPKQVSDPSAADEVKYANDLLSSMEDNSDPVTADDIAIVEGQTGFAIEKVKEYIEANHPTYKNLELRFSEWYFTDDNTDSNIVVAMTATTPQNSTITVLYVAQIVTDSNRNHRLVNIYRPDERYAIYE